MPHPRLSRVATSIGAVDDEARRLAADLLDTMRGTGHSVGVAAPQIGVSARAFCVDVTGHRKARSCHGELVLYDPVVVSSSAPVVGREGCMSVPEITGDAARASELVLRGTGLDGRPVTISADALRHVRSSTSSTTSTGCSSSTGWSRRSASSRDACTAERPTAPPSQQPRKWGGSTIWPWRSRAGC